MENIPVFSNRLDESNGIVENVHGMKAKKTPWHLRFAPKAKGIVSFVQNLLSPLTQKEGVRGGQLFAFFQSAAVVVVVGIALLVGSNAAVQAECDPPIFDVCFHKADWSKPGKATMYVEVNLPPAESDQRYELVWRGLKKIFNPALNRDEVTYRDDPKPGRSASQVENLAYPDFWWPSGMTEDSWEYYGVDIYEGHWDYDNPPEGEYRTWVRDTWIGSAQLYSYQEAAEVNLNASLFPDFDLWTYYCEIDWDTPLANLRYGYILGSWTYDNSRQEFYYEGVHGSPRFDYGSSCSYEFLPRKYVGGFSSYSVNPYGPPRYPY